MSEQRIPLAEADGQVILDLRERLRRLVMAIEKTWAEECWECAPEGLWEEYVNARVALGVPIVMLPGGYDGSHFHFLFFDPVCDECPSCEEETASRPGESE